jgi:hypothetical protein
MGFFFSLFGVGMNQRKQNPLFGGAYQKNLWKPGLELAFFETPDRPMAWHFMRAILAWEAVLPCRGQAVYEPRLYADSFIGQSLEQEITTAVSTPASPRRFRQ